MATQEGMATEEATATEVVTTTKTTIGAKIVKRVRQATNSINATNVKNLDIMLGTVMRDPQATHPLTSSVDCVTSSTG